MVNRWVEEDLLETLDETGLGCIVFSPLAQGLLSDKYLSGVPEGSRAADRTELPQRRHAQRREPRARAPARLRSPRIAASRFAQMAIAWVLRQPGVTSALIGASSIKQLDENLAALNNLDFDDDELAEIDKYATEADVNRWRPPSGTGA